MNEAVLWEEYKEDRVRCTACRRYCILGKGQPGFCGIRKNVDGRLQLLTYGRPYAIHVDPIEKKPVLHMYPGYQVLSFGTTGCNYACAYCQNYDMSQRRDVQGHEVTPEQMVQMALDNGCEGIAYTYNEPTVFMEYAHDIGVLARKAGLINIFVSNGYETEEAISYAKDFLDVITVDFKGNASNEFYRRYISVAGADPIFDTLRLLKDAGIHVEITDLVVPEIGDSLEDARSMVERVRDIFGPEIPVSFLRFHPDYKLMEYQRTPAETLEAHYVLARELGMKFVYIGNLPGSNRQNTYCPDCGSLCIRRSVFNSEVLNLTSDGKCRTCGYDTGIILAKDTGDYLSSYQ